MNGRKTASEEKTSGRNCFWLKSGVLLAGSKSGTPTLAPRLLGDRLWRLEPSTISAYNNQLVRAIDYQLFDRDLTFEENIARVFAILRIMDRLTSMLLKQTDRFLKCFGGPQTIGVQQIVEWARHDAERGAWLSRSPCTANADARMSL